MIGLSSAPLPIPSFSLAANPPLSTPAGIQTNFYDAGFTRFTTDVEKNNGKILNYPLDIPKYIITFTISEYTRNSLNEVGMFKAAPNYPGIIMPLPEGLQDLDSVNWAELEAGVLTGAAISALGPVGGLVPSALIGAAQGFGGGQTGAVGGFLGGAAAGAINNASIALSLKGIAPNQFVTLLMRGPQYKRHHFKWTLAPNNFQEADQLRQIIQTFRNAMAVGINAVIANAPVVWNYPHIFFVRLYPNSKSLYKFKPCVINNFAVNYTPAGKASFRRNPIPGTNDGNNPPSIVTIEMEMIELEFWTEGNYDDTNDPSNVYYSNANPTSATSILNTLASAAGIDIETQQWNILAGHPPGSPT